MFECNQTEFDNRSQGRRLVKIMQGQGAQEGREHYALSKLIQRRQRAHATIVMESAGINRALISNFTQSMFGPQCVRTPMYMGVELVSILRRDGALEGAIKKHLVNLIETVARYEDKVNSLPPVVVDATPEVVLAESKPINAPCLNDDGRLVHFVEAGQWVRTSLGYGKVDRIFEVGGRMAVRVTGMHKNKSVWKEETINFTRLEDMEESPLLEFISQRMNDETSVRWKQLIENRWAEIKNPQRNVYELERIYGAQSVALAIRNCPFVQMRVSI